MLRFFALACVLAIATPVWSSDDHHDGSHHEHAAPSAPPEGEIRAAPDRAVIQVRGMVCSFCAHGVEKSLGKLDILDDAHFGNGVQVDIEAHRVVLALRPGAAIPFADIHRRIKKAGYDPVRFHLRLRGALERVGEGWALASGEPGQRFALTGLAGDVNEGDALDLSAHLDADVAESLAPEAPVPVNVDARL